jgi:hypothetical protein
MSSRGFNSGIPQLVDVAIRFPLTKCMPVVGKTSLCTALHHHHGQSQFLGYAWEIALPPMFPKGLFKGDKDLWSPTSHVFTTMNVCNIILSVALVPLEKAKKLLPQPMPVIPAM